MINSLHLFLRSIIYLLLSCIASSTFSQSITIGLLQNDSLALNGYTLWTPSKSTYLIDNCGFLVNQWESDYNPGLSCYLLESGQMMRAGRIPGVFNGGGIGGIIEVFNWDGELDWSYDIANDKYHQHHDVEPLPNGNILVIAWEKFTPEEAKEMGALEEQEYWAEAIFEISPEGSSEASIVWEWHLWDHLIEKIEEIGFI